MISRVHWLLWNLPSEFKSKYQLVYDYAFHNYCFYRMNGRKLYDLFIIVRTSKRCFRVSYVNAETKEMQAFSCRKSVNVARRMWYIYKIDQEKTLQGESDNIS